MAAKPPVDKPLQDYAFFQQLTALPYIEAIYLYGSRARGDHDERSDIDLAIDCPSASEEEWKAVKKIADEADILLKVGPTRLDKITDRLMRQLIIHQRKLLYLRDYGGDAIEMRSRMAFINRLQKRHRFNLDALQPLLEKVAPEELTRAHWIEVMPFFVHAYRSLYLMMRKCLIHHGVRSSTPLQVIRDAYLANLLDNRMLWEQMVEDEIKTGGKPLDLPALKIIYGRIPEYLKAMETANRNTMEAMRIHLSLEKETKP